MKQNKKGPQTTANSLQTGSVHLRISLDGQTISDSHFEREQLAQEIAKR